MNILLIDDDKDFLRYCSEQLLKENWTVTACSNSQEARSVFLGRDCFDIAVIDLMLPPEYRMEGLELLRDVKRIMPDTSVVLITQKNSGTVEIVSHAMREGANHFLDKNLDTFGPNLIITLKTIAKERRRKIFISHGHNALLKLQLKDFLTAQLKLEALILADQPSRGLTVVEKLERISERCCFATILMTLDDEQPDGARRARQNVIHEIGFFQGKYGRQNVVLLAERGVELFTNISGIVRIDFEPDHFAEVFEPLRVELSAALVVN